MAPGPLRMQASQEGEGAPLVLIGGGLTGWASWQPFVPRLARHGRVIRLQPLNVQFGLEDRLLPEDYSVRTESRALGVALDGLGVDGPADFVAWSYGALATLTFALDHPERVRSLVLIEPPALWLLEDQGRAHAEVRRLEQQFPEASAEITEDMLAAFLAIAGFVPAGADPRQLPQWAQWTGFRRSLRNTPAVFAHHDQPSRVRAFTRPVLLVTGIGTSPFLHDITGVLARSLPDARVIALPAGHAPHLVSTDAFLGELAAFLAARP